MKKDKKLPPSTKGSTSKMRIQQFDPASNLLVSDRLVEMKTELMNGPSEKWDGPITIEATMADKDQVDQLVAYLNRIKGDLPLVVKSPKPKSTTKSIDKMLSEKEPLLDLVKTVKEKAKTQEDLIKILREYDFVFVDRFTVQDVGGEDKIKLKDLHIAEDYQFMVRKVKEAKDPANDKFDWRLVFGIKILGERVGKYQVYLWGKWDSLVKKPWADAKKINFKKVELIYSFPEFMDYNDRKRWRQENRKILLNQEKGITIEPSPWFVKWSPYVKTN